MLTKRILNMTPSATVELTAKVAELKQQGVDVIGFNLGEPDFDTPDYIKEAAKKAIDEGFTKYTPVAGLLELREAICKKLKKDNNLDYAPNEIIVSTGGKQALVNAVLALCEQGDEVIVITPCWVSYIEMVKIAESTPVLVPADEANDFQMDIEKVKAAITDKTKAIILNTPNNPTGAVYTEESLKELADLAVKHNFYIIADEIYEELVYEGNKHISIATLSPEVKDRVIVINGFSKAYAMTGWRMGYAAGPASIIKAMGSLQGHTTTNANSITQKAAIAALAGAKDSIEFMKTQFDERRKYLIDRLRNMENITCANAEGAFYLMPNVSKLFGKTYKDKVLKDSFDVADFLLEEAHIALVPGAAFEAPDNVRISYSNSLENIKEGMDRMEKALGVLK